MGRQSRLRKVRRYIKERGGVTKGLAQSLAKVGEGIVLREEGKIKTVKLG